MRREPFLDLELPTPQTERRALVLTWPRPSTPGRCGVAAGCAGRGSGVRRPVEVTRLGAARLHCASRQGEQPNDREPWLGQGHLWVLRCNVSGGCEVLSRLRLGIRPNRPGPRRRSYSGNDRADRIDAPTSCGGRPAPPCRPARRPLRRRGRAFRPPLLRPRGAWIVGGQDVLPFASRWLTIHILEVLC